MVSLWPSMEDYDSNISLLIGLLLLATSAAFAATYLRETSRRIEQSFIGWANVSEEISDWSRREYFLERILLECSRAQSDGGFFAVLSLRVSGQSGNNNENILRSMRALERFVSDYDCLSSLGPNEIGVIALGLQDRDAKGTAQQLIQAIVDGLSGDESGDESGEVDVQAGWAVYGKDADEPVALVGKARERLMQERQIIAGPEETNPADAA